ncbi:protein broad-minded [Anabrus simplex]|uniref:protein broad-minded n=1 Tax=Anabrus simplex TaxID=316456 RepID=UPI0035A2ED5D
MKKHNIMEITNNCPKNGQEAFTLKPPFWLKELTKEHLSGILDKELKKLPHGSRTSWKDAAYDVMKIIKESREMVTLLQSVKSEFSVQSPDFVCNVNTSQSHASKHCRGSNSSESEIDLYDDSHQRQIVEDTSYYKPHETRVKALHCLINIQPLEAVSSEYWLQLQQNLLDGLCDKDQEVFDLCIKIHAKILSSSSPPEVIKDGFLSLIEGLRSYYSRKFHELLPMFESGIDNKLPVHSHVLRISHLIFHTLKQMPKNWMKFGKSIVNEIVDAFLALITMHTYDCMYSQTFLYPFHLLAIFDPDASWCVACFYGKFGYDTFLSKQSRIVVLLRYIAEEIHAYLKSPSAKVILDFDSNYSSERVKFSTFLHCINIISIIGSSKSGQCIFPVASKVQDKLYSLPNIFERLLILLNERNNATLSVLENHIVDAVKRLLKCKDSPLLNDYNFASVLLRPLEKVTEDFCDIPPHTLQLLTVLCESVYGRYHLLGVSALQDQIVQYLHSSSTRHNIRKQSGVKFSSPDEYCPAHIIAQCASILLKCKNADTDSLVSLLKIITKLYNYHDAVVILNDQNVTVIAPAARTYKELSSLYDVDLQPCQENSTSSQSQMLLSALREFLLEVGSSPLGVVELSQYDSLIADLLRTILSMPCVPWYDYELRRKVALLAAHPEGGDTLAEDGCKAISHALNKLWAAHEAEDYIVKGLDREIELAEKEFFSIVYVVSCTLTGTEVLLRDQQGSEETLVESSNNPPSTVAELLTLECGMDPWHYTGLLVLRILAANLDTWLHLETTLGIQNRLLTLQRENIVSPIREEDKEEKTTKKNIIIDECSLLRHQILMSTYVIGGPSERTIPSIEMDFDTLEDDEGPRLFGELPNIPIRSPNVRSSRYKSYSDLQKFLQDTRKGLHDSNWLVRARKLFRTACQEPVKPVVLLELVEQVAQCTPKTSVTINWPGSGLDDGSILCDEEILAINMAVRYGCQSRLLQTCRPNTENLRQFLLLTQTALNYRHNVPTFKGFDWFTATVFLLCGGNTERCCNFMTQFVTVPAAVVLWPVLAEANDIKNFMFTFSHLLESLLAMELPTLHGAMKLAGVPCGLVCFSWLRQCFWNILDWGQICQWLALCVLHPADMCLYFCIALLRHIQPHVIKEAVKGNVWEAIKLTPITGFRVGDNIAYLEEISRRHRSRILSKLHDIIVV